jgi:hypothetical protein
MFCSHGGDAWLCKLVDRLWPNYAALRLTGKTMTSCFPLAIDPGG